ICEKNITLIDFTPALFSAFVDEAVSHKNNHQYKKLSSLKSIIIGGEAINVNAVKKFKQTFPAIELVNAYGPTETSIGVVFYRIPDVPPDSIPIGKPINNTNVY